MSRAPVVTTTSGRPRDAPHRGGGLALAAVIVASAVVLSGCTADAPAAPTSTIADTSGVADDLLPFYTQRLEWAKCGTGLECATVTAPLDWDEPSVGELELAVIRHRATDAPSLGSLFMNPGGPGFSGVDAVGQDLGFRFGVPLIERFDLVSWDPRGVGRSAPVLCLDDDEREAMSDAAADLRRWDAAWEAQQLAAARAFVDACVERSGALLPYISTVATARDLDLLRALTGETTLDYLGLSYGTLLGATYADLYPERVGRLVLDGAIDPATPPWEARAAQLGGFETALRSFLADCVTRADCPFAGTGDDALAELVSLLATVDAAPIRAGDGRRMNGEGLMAAVQAALYSREEWRTLRRALSEAIEGRAGVAFTLIDSFADGDTNLGDALTAYRCNDDGALPATWRADYEARIIEIAPTFAPYYIGIPDVCALWPVPARPAPGAHTLTAEGAAPIVVIGTTGDPATPFAAAESLAAQLSSGVLLVHDGEGHTAYPGSSACVSSAVEAFFVDGTVPADGLVCR